MNTLLITVIPSIILIAYFFLSDKFKEPKQLVFITFCLGVLICFPAGVINNFMSENFGNSELGNKDLTYSFLGPAWSEELLKFLILFYIVLPRSEFNERMDGIVYGVAVSLGFATYENYDYVFRLADLWDVPRDQMAIWRSFSAVPMHGLNGSIMGFFLGLYVFYKKINYLLLSLFVPFFLHGTYNFINYPFHYIILIIMFFISIKLHSKLKKLQYMKKIEDEKLKK